MAGAMALHAKPMREPPKKAKVKPTKKAKPTVKQGKAPPKTGKGSGKILGR